MNTGKSQNFATADAENFFVERFIFWNERQGTSAAVAIVKRSFNDVGTSAGITIHKLKIRQRECVICSR